MVYNIKINKEVNMKIKEEIWYDPNNVNSDNFNETMYGYTKRALKDMEEALKNNGFDDEQIQDVKRCFKSSLNWSVDMMTMEEARKYNK